jgi:hypothetical protein
MAMSSEFYLTLALRCREVASLITRDDLRGRLERIIADLERQAVGRGPVVKEFPENQIVWLSVDLQVSCHV